MKKILKNSNFFIIIILCIIFASIFAINCNTIWSADDYSFYNNVWNGNQNFSFKRILDRSMNFYLTWTGRFVSTFVNYIFLFFNKNIFNVINSLMFILFIYLIYKISNISNNHKPALLIFSFILVWFFVPQLGEVAFWQIGSIIYLWTFVSVLFIILIFSNLLKNQSKIKNNFISIILLFILGLIAGNGFETNSIMLVCFEVLCLIYIKFIQKRKIPLCSIFLLLSSTLGFCSNLFSPGNAVRMSSMGTSTSLLDTLIFGTGGVFFRGILQTNIYILIIANLILYYIYILYANKNKNKFLLLLIFSLILVFCVSALSICIYFYNYEINDFLVWFYSNYKLFNISLIILAFILICIVLICYIFRKKLLSNINKDCNALYLLLIISAIIGICSYIVTSLAWPRSYMGMSSFLIIAICILLSNIKFNFKYINICKYVTVIAIVVGFSISYFFVFKEIYNTNNWFKKIDAQIVQEINSGKEYISIETYSSNNKYNAASVERWVIPPIITDTDYVTENRIHKDYEWINISITNYYFKSSTAWNNGKRIVGY